MITLMRKELRELALPAVALVCCAVIIAGMDLMYNLYYPQYKGQGIALGIWLIISIAVAFLGGATSIARENRARTVFLSEWPVSRGALWVAKAAVSFVLTLAVIAAGFGACLLAAGLAHYEQITDLHDAAVNLAYVLPLCFAFGLLWSGLIGSVLGAGALGLVTLAALGSGLTWFLAFYLPARWGPYVDRPMYGLSPTLIWIGTALVLLVGASPFVRYPVLEGKRRALVAVGLLVGLTVAAAVLLVGYKVVVWRPTLQQQVAEPGLSADGKTIYFRTAAESGDMRLRSSGLWVMPATGGRPRMVCRTGDAPLERLDNAATMQWKTGNVSAAYWAYDFGRGKLLQMAGLPIALSPDGRYRVTMEQRGVLVRDEQGRVVKAPRDNYGAITLDNRMAYYMQQGGQLMALELRTGQERELGRVSNRAYPVELSPDGKLLALSYRDLERKRSVTVLMNVQTGAKKILDGSAFWAGFVRERYLWLWEKSDQRNENALAVVDVVSGRMIGRLPQVVAGGRVLWHQDGVPYVVFAVEIMEPGPRPGTLQGADIRRVFIANPDGTGARLLRVESRQVLGMTAEGRIVMWDRKRTFLSWDPVRGEEKVLVRLP